jgi:hypothetical protein
MFLIFSYHDKNGTCLELLKCLEMICSSFVYLENNGGSKLGVAEWSFYISMSFCVLELGEMVVT